MPSNICVIGARTACCSALSTDGTARSSPEPRPDRLVGGAVAACNEEIRTTAEVVATAIERNESSERKMVFMRRILSCVTRNSNALYTQHRELSGCRCYDEHPSQ